MHVDVDQPRKQRAPTEIDRVRLKLRWRGVRIHGNPRDAPVPYFDDRALYRLVARPIDQPICVQEGLAHFSAERFSARKPFVASTILPMSSSECAYDM